MDIAIVPARSPAEIDVMRTLFREYAEALDFDLCFQGFEEELAALPGRYTEPRGAMLLAKDGHHPAGCIALRPLDEDGICEMKRLFVRPEYRRRGVGRKLSKRLVEEARMRGYDFMRLDTIASMGPAQKLYRSLGFYEIEPYCHNPLDNAVYMECSLYDETTR